MIIICISPTRESSVITGEVQTSTNIFFSQCDTLNNYTIAWQIVTKTAIHHFASLSEKEMSDWISAFQSVAFKDDCSRHTIEEDNDLYCSSGEGKHLILVCTFSNLFSHTNIYTVLSVSSF